MPSARRVHPIRGDAEAAATEAAEAPLTQELHRRTRATKLLRYRPYAKQRSFTLPAQSTASGC